MSEVINFNSIDQIDDLTCKLKKDSVSLKNKDGKIVKFNICEMEIDDYFDIQNIANNADVKIENGKPVIDMTKKQQIQMAIDMFVLMLVDENGNKINEKEKITKFIKSSFSHIEIMKAIDKASDISGLSEKSMGLVEKN